jgi:hypothetical protein
MIELLIGAGFVVLPGNESALMISLAEIGSSDG